MKIPEHMGKSMKNGESLLKRINHKLILVGQVVSNRFIVSVDFSELLLRFVRFIGLVVIPDGFVT